MEDSRTHFHKSNNKQIEQQAKRTKTFVDADTFLMALYLFRGGSCIPSLNRNN
jgi:hypothetical protein